MKLALTASTRLRVRALFPFALVGMLGIAMFAAPHIVSADPPIDPSECKERGGEAECVQIKTSPYRYAVCDDFSAGAANQGRASCAIYRLAAGTSPEQFTPAITSFEQCANNFCSNSVAQTSSWGVVVPTNCFNSNTTQPKLDTPWPDVIADYETFQATGTANFFYSSDGPPCGRNYSDLEVAERRRLLACPIGFQRRAGPGGVSECWKLKPKLCPTCADPVSMTDGQFVHTETDYQGEGPQPLRFVRSYYSASVAHPFAAPNPDPRHSMIGEYWSTTYDRRIYPVTDSSYVSAVAVRDNGEAKYFDLAGNEIDTGGRVADTLVPSGGGWKYTSADDATEIYDATGNLLRLINRQGLSLTLTYSSSSTPQSVAPSPGLVIAVTDPYGRSLTFTYSPYGLMQTMTDPMGAVYTYGYSGTPPADAGAYSSEQSLASVTKPQVGGQPAIRRYSYGYAQNAAVNNFPGLFHLLTGVTDENNLQVVRIDWAWRRDQFAWVYHLYVPSGAYSFYMYSDRYYMADPNGVENLFYRANVGGVDQITSVLRQCAECPADARARTYDVNGFEASKTDWNGNITTYVHDSRGLETSRTEAFGTSIARTITTQSDAYFRKPVRIDEPGRRTSFTYDANGNKLSETVLDTASPASRTTTYTYNSSGQVLSMDGPRTDVNDVTSYTYGASGNISTVTDALGHVTRLTDYDANGRLLRAVDPNGVVTSTVYDAVGRMTSRTVAGATTAYEYDPAGQVSKVTLADGSFLQYSYDGMHHLTEVADAAGNTIHYTLDVYGNRKKTDTKDSSGVLKRTQAQIFDSLARMTEVDGANQQLTSYAYDQQGNRTTESQRVGNIYLTTTTAFDALNRATQVTDANNGVTVYALNALDQLVSVKDPTNLTTSYVLNALGDKIQQSSPDSGVTSYTYDAAGNRTSQTDARGITAMYSYDALNRLTSIDYPGTAEDVVYFYDGTNYSGQVANGIGRLTGVRDASGTSVSTYTPRGMLASETRTISGTVYPVSYAYNSADRLTREIYPSGRVVDYARDALGRVSGVSTSSAGATATLASSLGYLPFGPATGWTLGNGVAVTHSYDQDYRLTRYTDNGVLDRSLAYDSRNLITGITDNLASGNSQTLSYDPLARLATASGSYGALAYAYNGVGDRTQETRSSVADNYSYTAGSHHLASIGGGHSVSFGYDAAGNTTTRGALSLAYNNAGRLSSATQGATTEQNTYNAAGQRVKKVVGGVETRFIHDRNGQIIDEFSTSTPSETSDEYIWLDGKPLARLHTFALHEAIVDNSDAAFNTSGAWTSGSAPGQYGSSYTKRGPAVELSGERIVDDTDSGWTLSTGYTNTSGSWIPSTSCGTLCLAPLGAYASSEAPYGPTFQISNGCYPGCIFSPALFNGNDPYFAWHFSNSSIPGRYRAYVRWVPLTNSGIAYYYVRDYEKEGGYGEPADRSVDQANSSNGWYSLGSYDSIYGQPVVQLFYNRYSAKVVVADAAKIVPIENTDSDYARWSPPASGTFDVYARWPSVSGASTHAPFAVKDSSGTATTISEDQSQSGGQWKLLGTFTFSSVTTQGVMLGTDWDATVLADAVRFVGHGVSFGGSTVLDYVHTDHLGTPQTMTDPSGTVVWNASYEPFGAATISIATITSSLRFPGQYFDAETGLNQNWWRDYDPSIGRYLQSDPIGLDGGLNTYAYTEDNPLVRSDPTGLRIDWGRYVVNNPITWINFTLLDMYIAQSGFKDDCFVLRVTGGDRYRDPHNPTVIRSATNGRIVKDSSQTSPHLIERGARAVDFNLENVPNCECRKVTNADVDGALLKTDFSPANTERDYPNAPHTHVALPPGPKFDYTP